MTKLLSRDEILVVLTTNLQEWKRHADVSDAQDLNDELTEDDISTIISPEFYDDIHSMDDTWNVLEKHFLDTELDIYTRDTFILIHNIYNN